MPPVRSALARQLKADDRDRAQARRSATAAASHAASDRPGDQPASELLTALQPPCIRLLLRCMISGSRAQVYGSRFAERYKDFSRADLLPLISANARCDMA